MQPKLCLTHFSTAVSSNGNQVIKYELYSVKVRILFSKPHLRPESEKTDRVVLCPSGRVGVKIRRSVKVFK